MNEIELFLRQVLGNFRKKQMMMNGKYITSYSLHLYNYPTIDLVVISPYIYEYYLNSYVMNPDRCFYFFLYDNETEMIVGNIVEIDCDWDWKEEILYYTYTAEERLDKCECPECSFWLVQRANIYGHKFIGCSGFPDCTHSIEITKLFD